MLAHTRTNAALACLLWEQAPPDHAPIAWQGRPTGLIITFANPLLANPQGFGEQYLDLDHQRSGAGLYLHLQHKRVGALGLSRGATRAWVGGCVRHQCSRTAHYRGVPMRAHAPGCSTTSGTTYWVRPDMLCCVSQGQLLQACPFLQRRGAGGLRRPLAALPPPYLAPITTSTSSRLLVLPCSFPLTSFPLINEQPHTALRCNQALAPYNVCLQGQGTTRVSLPGAESVQAGCTPTPALLPQSANPTHLPLAASLSVVPTLPSSVFCHHARPQVLRLPLPLDPRATGTLLPQVPLPKAEVEAARAAAQAAGQLLLNAPTFRVDKAAALVVMPGRERVGLPCADLPERVLQVRVRMRRGAATGCCRVAFCGVLKLLSLTLCYHIRLLQLVTVYYGTFGLESPHVPPGLTAWDLTRLTALQHCSSSYDAVA